MLERMITLDGITTVSGVEVLEYVRDNIDQLGWEVWDDYIDDNNQLVIKSTGSSHGDINRLPCYLLLQRTNTIYITICLCVYWDPETHTGYERLIYDTGTSTTSYYNRSQGVYVVEDSSNSVGIYGNLDILSITSYSESRGSTYGVMFFRLDNIIWEGVGTIQSDVNAGTNVTVQLLSGQASTLAVGGSYAIITPIGQISYTSVTNLDLENDTATLSSLYYDCQAGTVFGVMPFPWIGIGNGIRSTSYLPAGIPYTESNIYTTGTTGIYSYFTLTCGVIGAMNEDDYNHGQMSLLPYLIYQSGAGLVGTCSYIQYFNYGSKGDIMGVNERDTGAVESSTATSITATSKTWVEDAYVSKTLVITSGDYSEESRYITGNTTDTITFDPELSPTVSGGVTFSICDAVYMRMVDESSTYCYDYLGIKVI